MTVQNDQRRHDALTSSTKMTISTSPNFASIIGPQCLLTTYLEWTWVGDGPSPAALNDSPAPTYGSFRLIRGFSFRPSIPLPPDMSWKLPPSPVHGRRYVDRARSTGVGLTWTSVQVFLEAFYPHGAHGDLGRNLFARVGQFDRLFNICDARPQPSSRRELCAPSHDRCMPTLAPGRHQFQHSVEQYRLFHP